MTATQRKGRVKSHTRVVNGKRQKVRSHSRQLQPSRARHNARRAWRSMRGRRHGAAATYAALAVAEIGAWFTLRGFSLVAVTLGIGAIGVGVAARRATPSTPKAPRQSLGSRLLDATPKELRHKPAQSGSPRYTGPKRDRYWVQGYEHAAEDAVNGGADLGKMRPTYPASRRSLSQYENGYIQGAKEHDQEG